MTRQRFKTNFPGVRYREHPTRKHGVKRDQYFTIRYKLNGKDKEEGLGWASEGWTAAKAYRHRSEIRENQKIAEGPQTLKEKRKIAKKAREQVKRENVTLKAFFEQDYFTIAQADKRPNTVIREEGLFRLWIDPVIGSMPMRDISPFDLERLKKHMAQSGQSPRSIEYALAVIRQIFNTATRLGKFSGENPATKVKFPKPDNARTRFLTRQEAEALLSALQAKSADSHDMTLLALYCGLRQGEILSLQWQDVDLEKGTLTIRDAKAGSRIAFLNEKTSAMLKSRKAIQPNDTLVFPGRKGQMERVSHTFRRTIEELRFNEGISDPRLKVTFHTCRHTFASWLVEAGQDLYIVQRLLGHKTNVMTQRYAHVGENQFRAAVNSLEKAMNQSEAGQLASFPK
jgi:integrase